MIESFLTSRCQRVVLDGIISDEVNVTSGVPKGSVIGPALFLIYINDIVDNVKSKIRLFADYNLIYGKLQTAEDQSTYSVTWILSPNGAQTGSSG